MRQQLKKHYILSLLIHSAFLFLIFQSPEPETTDEALEPFFLELSPPSQPKDTGSKSKKTKHKSRNTKNYKKGSTFNYRSLSPATYNAGSFKEHLEKQEDRWAGEAVMETMNSIGLSDYSSSHSFFETMAAKLNFHTPFPKEFWEHKVSGQFWFKILVNKKGQLIQVIDTSKSQPALRAYILINIYQALKNNLPKSAWYQKDQNVALYLHFDYSISSIGSQKEVQSVSYFKNRFNLVRVAKVPNFIEELSQDYARYIPPVVPTPLGPIVNFGQIYRMINAWSDTDPLVKKKRRLEMTKEKMELMLKKTQGEHYN